VLPDSGRRLRKRATHAQLCECADYRRGPMGNPVMLVSVDAKGNALTGTLAVTVQLDNTNRLIITPGNSGRLASISILRHPTW